MKKILVICITIGIIFSICACSKNLENNKTSKQDDLDFNIVNTAVPEKRQTTIEDHVNNETETTMETTESVDTIESNESLETIEETTMEETFKVLTDEELPSKKVIEKEISSKKWGYGWTPCEWIFVEPNKQIISNARPNGSMSYSVTARVFSGPKGCYLPIYKRNTKNFGDHFEGRFVSFSDSKKKVETFEFDNTLNDIMYKGETVENILAKHYTFEKKDNGLLYTNNGYLNVIYVDELDRILGN